MTCDASLTVIQETEILGKKIKMYRSIENPLFKATDVAEWIDHSKVPRVLKTIANEEKGKANNLYFDNRVGCDGTWFHAKHGFHEVCMKSRKPITKQMKKEIKQHPKLFDYIRKLLHKDGYYKMEVA